MISRLGLAAAGLSLGLALASAANAADSTAQLKADIDGFIARLQTRTHGFLKWEGGRIEFRREGAADIADIEDARIAVQNPEANPPPGSAHVTFDHIVIRREPALDNAVRLSIALPKEAVLQVPDQDEIKLSVNDGKLDMVLDAQTGRARETSTGFAGARIDVPKTGDWVGFGPLSFASKVETAADGGWISPIDFELKKIEFFFAQVPVGGAIERIVYNARSAGPDLAALNRLRDRFDAMQAKEDASPKERLDAIFEMLQGMPTLFSQSKGELAVEGLAARAPTGEPFVTLAKASMGGALTGLSGDAAALRITMRHEGLTLMPAALEPSKVPRRAIIDFGVEEVGTGPLRSILEAAGKLRAEASDEEKTRAQQQMLGAAAMLHPVFRIYDLAVDTDDVGIDATAEARGSPLSPKGYAAEGDVSVRGFDALPALVGDEPLAAYLPLLKEIGAPASAGDGTPRLKFHVASTPQKLVTLNGNDVSAWFQSYDALAVPPRDLRIGEPPMTGADVREVQRALTAAKVTAPLNGTYDGATAAAVARFQKQNAINVDGVVNAATRQKLGIAPEPAQPTPQPAGPKKGAN